jgi:hypothetical protein
MRSFRTVLLFFFLSGGVSSPAFAQAPAKANPYLDPAARLYQNFEFQDALRTVERALAWPSNTPEEEVRAAMLEGVIVAQLGKADRAVGAFKRALVVDPAAKLPFTVSPKVSRLFAQAKAELAKMPKKPEPPPVVAAVAPPAPVVQPPVPAPPKPAPVVPPAVPTPAPVADGSKKAEPSPVQDTGVVLGAALITDVIADLTLGRSIVSEIHGGYRIGRLDFSVRMRPGRLVGIGVLAGYGLDVGPITAFGGLRGDRYLGSDVSGFGAVAGARKGLVAGVGALVSVSVERFVGTAAQSMGAVLSVGVDWRQ